LIFLKPQISHFQKDTLVMKHLLTLLLCSATLWGMPAAAAPVVIKGEVLEVKDVDAYTYLRLKTATGETWAAVAKTPVSKGVSVTVEDAEQMDNFESKTLKKTFPKIYFGRLPMSANDAAKINAAHASVAKKSEFSGDVKVAKATGAQAYTVADIFGKSATLKDKPVTVHARIVKFSPSIMGTNWLHVQDGTGSGASATQDLVITTNEAAKAGDTVLVTGTVRTDKDFGAGYFYKVMVENAKLQK